MLRLLASRLFPSYKEFTLVYPRNINSAYAPSRINWNYALVRISAFTLRFRFL
jgi:hypothetical protein